MLTYFNEENSNFYFANNVSFDVEEIHSYYANQPYTYGNYYTEIGLTSEATIISNSFYFEKLGNRHAINRVGTCCVVAAEILLGYYDTFLNDTIVSEQYDQPAVQNINETDPTITDFSISPGVDSDSRSDFHDYLCDIATNQVGDDPRSNGMTVYNQKQMIVKYLQEKGISYTTNSSEGNFADLCANKAKTVVKDTIDANRPVIVNGEGHSTVAFAYDDDYVWVHTGWGFVAATPWRTFESGMFFNYSAGAIDVLSFDNNEHIHSDNYFCTNLNAYYCPCGETYSNAVLEPSIYGISSTFNSDDEYNRFFENGVEIRNSYKRVAITNGQELTLSAKKSGEGEAYWEFNTTKSIRNIEFDISYYSYSDKLYSNNSTAEIWAVAYDSGQDCLYYSYLSNLLEIGLSTSRNNPTHLHYNFTGDEIFGLYFYTSAPATGTFDRGRISVSSLEIEHSTITTNHLGNY